MKPDLAIMVGATRREELSDSFEEMGDGLVMARESAFELGELGGEFLLVEEDITQLYEGPHNRDGHGDGSWTAEHAGEHGHALFGKNSRGFAHASATAV